MNPAPSVIIFTALSGLGFGLMFWLGIGLPAMSGVVAFVFYAIAYGLAVGGLLSSALHLANKKNALKAFRQWRSSWLSREGIMAVATLLLMAPNAISQIFLDGAIRPLGMLAGLCALITIFTTSMIYTQLKTVARWNTPITPVLFLLYGLAGGGLLAGQTRAAGVLLLLLAVVQIAYWVYGDKRGNTGQSTIETATGLGHVGTAETGASKSTVRQLEAPHTGANYLLNEMAYDVARKHVRKLRLIALICAMLLPAALLLAVSVTHVVALLAVLLHLVGLFAARWLFFAEAAHVVRLYYDK